MSGHLTGSGTHDVMDTEGSASVSGGSTRSLDQGTQSTPLTLRRGKALSRRRCLVSVLEGSRMMCAAHSVATHHFLQARPLTMKEQSELEALVDRTPEVILRQIKLRLRVDKEVQYRTSGL